MVRKLGKRWAIPLSFIVLLLSLMLSPTPSVALPEQPSDLIIGPYVDNVVYEVIPNLNQRINALVASQIEMDLSYIDFSDWGMIGFDPDLSIHESVDNGYGQITINCAKYPLNISGFRRAFAHAYDKRAVQQNIMLGYAQLLDSLVPHANSWCIENELEWHYYDPDPITGNQILDYLGFTIQGDGWRTAPDGSPIDIEIIYDESSPDVAGGIAFIGTEALTSLHIHSHTLPQDFNTYIDTLDSHGNYDMIFYTTKFYGNDVDWLAYSYWSDLANEPYENPSNFQNATYDSYRDALLNSTTYEEVFEASSELQRILHYNVPRLVVYDRVYPYVYRNDVFTGHVDDLDRHIAGTWTLRKIRKLDGTQGGTVPIGVSEEPDSFNIWLATSATSKAIFDELFPSLYSRAPDLTPYPYLAENTTIETHVDNWAIPEGHTRFTIDINQKVTWSDGTPLTARDVALSYNYSYFASGIPVEPEGDFVTSYALTNYTVVVEYSTESYWHFSDFAFQYIIPYHIFNDETGIGHAGMFDWNPVFNPDDPLVTAGPFMFTDYELGEFYEISANSEFSDWFHTPTSPEPPPPDHTASTPDTGSPTGTGAPTSPISLASAVVAGGSSIVIVVMVILMIRHKQVE